MGPERHLQGENDMGEIRVKVLLTNSADEMAHRRRKLKKSAIHRNKAARLKSRLSKKIKAAAMPAAK